MKHAKKSLLIPIIALFSVVAIAAGIYMTQAFSAYAGDKEAVAESAQNGNGQFGTQQEGVTNEEGELGAEPYGNANIDISFAVKGSNPYNLSTEGYLNIDWNNYAFEYGYGYTIEDFDTEEIHYMDKYVDKELPTANAYEPWGEPADYCVAFDMASGHAIYGDANMTGGTPGYYSGSLGSEGSHFYNRAIQPIFPSEYAENAESNGPSSNAHFLKWMVSIDKDEYIDVRYCYDWYGSDDEGQLYLSMGHSYDFVAVFEDVPNEYTITFDFCGASTLQACSYGFDEDMEGMGFIPTGAYSDKWVTTVKAGTSLDDYWDFIEYIDDEYCYYGDIHKDYYLAQKYYIEEGDPDYYPGPQEIWASSYDPIVTQDITFYFGKYKVSPWGYFYHHNADTGYDEPLYNELTDETYWDFEVFCFDQYGNNLCGDMLQSEPWANYEFSFTPGYFCTDWELDHMTLIPWNTSGEQYDFAPQTITFDSIWGISYDEMNWGVNFYLEKVNPAHMYLNVDDPDDAGTFNVTWSYDYGKHSEYETYDPYEFMFDFDQDLLTGAELSVDFMNTLHISMDMPFNPNDFPFLSGEGDSAWPPEPITENFHHVDVYITPNAEPFSGYEPYVWYLGYKAIPNDGTTITVGEPSYIRGEICYLLTLDYKEVGYIAADGNDGHLGFMVDPDTTDWFEGYYTPFVYDNLYEGTWIYLASDGTIYTYYVDSANPAINFSGSIKPLAAEGYHFTSWSIDGYTYPVGQTIWLYVFAGWPHWLTANYEVGVGPTPPGPGPVPPVPPQPMTAKYFADAGDNHVTFDTVIDEYKDGEKTTSHHETYFKIETAIPVGSVFSVDANGVITAVDTFASEGHTYKTVATIKPVAAEGYVVDKWTFNGPDMVPGQMYTVDNTNDLRMYVTYKLAGQPEPQPVPPGPTPPPGPGPQPAPVPPTPVNPGGGVAQTGDATPFGAIALIAVIAALGCGLVVRKEYF